MSRAIARASLIHMLPAHLEQIGIRPEPIFRQAGMGAEHMNAPLVVRRSQIHAALALAARISGTADIALSLGGAAEPAKLGPPGMAMLAGQTLESCLRGHMALMPRLMTDIEHRLWIEGNAAIFAHRLIGDDQSAWLLYEGANAFNVQMMRNILGPAWAPDLVTFPHACRGRRATYEAHFGCPVVFGVHNEARIYFPRELLKATRKTYPNTASPALGPDLMPIGRFCPVELERFEYDATRIQTAIQNMLEATLPYNALTITTASNRLGLSPRTLQRRLNENGWTFESLIDSLRHRLACERLADPALPITEIAMSLGYSDAAHFNRAFRRWESCSPSEYRQQKLKQH